jgi:hypothetical protein
MISGCLGTTLGRLPAGEASPPHPTDTTKSHPKDLNCFPII